jgi:hypothetical protein
MAVGASAFPSVSAASRHVRPWIVALARFGLAAKGAVYFVIGVLAARSALLHRGEVTDRKGALVEVLRQPMGKWFLLAMAIGLLGYVVWRLVEGIMDPEGHGTSAKGIARRVGSVGIAVIYAGLALSAVKLWAWGQNPGNDTTQTRQLSGEVLGMPGGAWLLGGIGLGIVIFGLVEIVRGLTGSFLKNLTRGMSARQARWASRVGRLGLIARGVVFGVIGGYGMWAAWAADERRVQGVAGALRALARTGGGWVLAAVGIGLAAYGVYMFFEARFRHITPP